MPDERPRRRRRDEDSEPERERGGAGSERRRRDDDAESERGSERRRVRERRRLSGAQLARQARNELADITGLKPEAVTSLERSDDGTWRVTVELLELSRIPETDDLLGSYEAELDESGELISYRRVRRYSRSQAQDQQLSGGAG